MITGRAQSCSARGRLVEKMALLIAIDAGGTGTRCWVGDETRVLGRASTGTAKIMTVGEEVATERLHEVVLAALSDAGAKPEDVTRTCIGLAGFSSEGVPAWADRTLRSFLPGDVLLCGDEEIALEAAFHGGPGVLIIAGTGSNIMGRCAGGKKYRAGGWGPILGDEGSGSWIGLEAIRAGLRAQDRGIATCLLREIEAFWELGSVGELVAKGNLKARPDFSELAKVVAACAEGGDALAQSVLDRAGVELADQVGLVVSKMKAAGCAAADAKHVAFVGSVLEKIPRVRKSMEEHLKAALPEVEVAQKPAEPLEGAMWKVRQSRES